MKKIRFFFSIVATLFLVAYSMPVVYAIDLTGNCSATGADCNLTKENKLSVGNTTVATFIQWALYILAAVSVIVIIVAGIQFVVSQGDSGKVARARTTILYAVVGLLIAVFATAIIQFIINNMA